jgi:hypothetical protein
LGRLEERVSDAERAQAALAELLDAARAPMSSRDRDALLLRFMLAAEATWKAAPLYLRSAHGVDEGSPKGCVRASLQVALLGAKDAEATMELLDDRSLVVHTDREELAQAIAQRIPRHAQVLRRWLEGMRGNDARRGAP